MRWRWSGRNIDPRGWASKAETVSIEAGWAKCPKGTVAERRSISSADEPVTTEPADEGSLRPVPGSTGRVAEAARQGEPGSNGRCQQAVANADDRPMLP
jgi:hypothetical protein